MQNEDAYPEGRAFLEGRKRNCQPWVLYMKIDPYDYPIILILAFVIGFVLAMALGFRPEYGSGGSGLDLTPPVLLQMIGIFRI
jgi:hypothetical protein